MGGAFSSEKTNSAHPETASCGPARRSHSVEILDVALLRLRFQPRCGLGLDHKLPFLNGHCAEHPETASCGPAPRSHSAEILYLFR